MSGGFCPCCGLAPPSSVALNVTPRQRRLLSYLEDCAKKSVSPSFDEIMVDADFKSKSHVAYTLTALEDRGHIRREFGKARSITVIGVPAKNGARA